MFKRLICLTKGHKWGFYAFVDNDGKCSYTRCSRCGKYQGKGKKVMEKWLNKESIDHYLIVGD